MTPFSINTQNFLVPADGMTRVVLTYFSGADALVLGTQQQINWTTYLINNSRFDPQGFYVDNSAGTAPVVIQSVNTAFTFTVPAGFSASQSFPSTAADRWNISGEGTVKIYWANYPVFPFSSASLIAPGDATAANQSLQIALETAGNALLTTIDADTSILSAVAPQTIAFTRGGNTAMIATSNAASTPVQISGTGAQYRITNASANYAAFNLAATSTSIGSFPTAGTTKDGYIIAPGATEVFSGVANAYLSAVLETGTGNLYVVNGTGL